MGMGGMEGKGVREERREIAMGGWKGGRDTRVV